LTQKLYKGSWGTPFLLHAYRKLTLRIAVLLDACEMRGPRLWSSGLLLTGATAVLVISPFLFVFGTALLPQAWLADLAVETGDRVCGVAGVCPATGPAINRCQCVAHTRSIGAQRAGDAAPVISFLTKQVGSDTKVNFKTFYWLESEPIDLAAEFFK
jgi:hypothetical protein